MQQRNSSASPATKRKYVRKRAPGNIKKARVVGGSTNDSPNTQNTPTLEVLHAMMNVAETPSPRQSQEQPNSNTPQNHSLSQMSTPDKFL